MSFQSDRLKKKVGKPFYDLGSLELKSSQNEQKPILKLLQSPNLSEISNSSVMFWMMSEPSSRTDNSFRLTPPWLQTIEKEYESLDQNF